MLYSYCKTFSINPMEAQNTPISMMTNLLQIHGEIEQYKADEIQKQMKK